MEQVHSVANVLIVPDTTRLWKRKALVADLDNDNDIDVVTISYRITGITWGRGGWLEEVEIAWIENTDGMGAFSKPVVIERADGPQGGNDPILHAVDIDADGDLDLLWPRHPFESNGNILWFENETGDPSGRFAQRHEISTHGSTPPFVPITIVPSDLDADGDLDLLSLRPFPYGGTIAWLESDLVDRQQRIPGDADGNGEVAFADFLLLAENFGKQADAVWAGRRLQRRWQSRVRGLPDACRELRQDFS